MKDTTTKRLLVVDDQPEITQHIKALIEKKTRYQVETSNHPIQALEKLREGGFNLVISDINMPEMSGIELLKSIKNIDMNLEVILLTGFSSYDTALEALQHRAYDYIEKPVNSQKLLHVIGNALSRQELSEEINRMVTKVTTLNRQLRSHFQHSMEYRLPHERVIAAAVLVDKMSRDIRRHLERGAGRADRLRSFIEGGAEPARLLTETVGLDEAMKGVEETLQRYNRVLGSMQKSPSRQDLGAFLKTEIETFTGLFPKVTLRTVLPDAPVVTSFDPELLAMALHNLLENALQAMNAGGEIVVTVEVAADQFRLLIEDSGPGFSEQDIEHAFRPFYSRKGQGSAGLGLAITERIVEAHDGKISLGRARLGGAKVTVELPLRSA